MARKLVRRYYRELLLWPWQRIRRGYSDRDLWSLDYYIETILASALRDLADCGSYVALDDDYQHCPDCGPENWVRLLHEMADGFELSANSWELFPSDEDRAKVDRAYALLAEFHDGLWD